jgi:hypothetical protein
MSLAMDTTHTAAPKILVKKSNKIVGKRGAIVDHFSEKLEI